MRRAQKRTVVALRLALTALLPGRVSSAFALEPAQTIREYAHTAWTGREGLSLGAIFAIAQTHDGYLWLGAASGLFRFDGIRAQRFQAPPGRSLPERPYSLLVTRDGTLWIGTFSGLASLRGGELRVHPELDGLFVTSLLEDREGTVWAGVLASTGRLCSLRSGSAQCDTNGGAFGSFVWSLAEDRSGALWAGAESGVWRFKPGPPRRYALPRARIGDLSLADDGRLLVGASHGGLHQLTGDALPRYPLRSATTTALLEDREVDSNKLLRDRDGGLWIGTHSRGLIHVHRSRADRFAKTDGLSSDVICSLFEDREGNVWVGTTKGLDRFRELSVTTVVGSPALKNSNSVVAATGGGLWIATREGLEQWKDGQSRVFDRSSGLPGDAVHSLFDDHRGVVWAFTDGGLAHSRDGRFVAVPGVPSQEVYSIAGDQDGHLWLSGNRGLSHLKDGRLVEHFPWSALGRRQQAKVVVPEHGGVWLAFWQDGGVSHFKDGKVRASFTASDGLGSGPVAHLRLDRDGAVWAATQEGGLSRIKDGRVATLTTANGLPCPAVHWSIEDDDRSTWLFTACGMVRIARIQLLAWIADQEHRIQTTVWDESDGVPFSAVSPAYFNPPVAKSTDGRLWFLSEDGPVVLDPRHLPWNELPPPVHVERVTADREPRWQSSTAAAGSNLRLPAGTRDLEIGYTALSFVAPEKVLFRHKLEGRDPDWQETGTRRQAIYTDLPPGEYRFRVIACNDSGVWNEEGASLDFTIEPAFHQTTAFRALLAAALAALLWAAYRLRVRVVERHAAEMGAFNERLLKAQEQERTRIAGELHDSVMQQIAALSLVLGTAKRKMAGDSEARDMVVEVQRKLIDVGTEVRQLSHDLYPPTLKQAGLAEVLRGYCGTFSQSRGIPVACDVDESVAELSPGTALALYRVAQEALGNAARHAAPTRVDVRLFRVGGDIVLTVADDGRGFESGRGEDGGLGLANMRERARQLGGTFELNSRPGRGTTVRVAVPFRIRER